MLGLRRLAATTPTTLVPRRQLCTTPSPTFTQAFWKWTTQQRPSWKESPTEAAVAFVVFGITGSTSVAVVRPTLKKTTGIEGSLKDGPWSYRIASILAVSPIYATMLVTFGTLAGRHRFFAAMSQSLGDPPQGGSETVRTRSNSASGSVYQPWRNLWVQPRTRHGVGNDSCSMWYGTAMRYGRRALHATPTGPVLCTRLRPEFCSLVARCARAVHSMLLIVEGK